MAHHHRRQRISQENREREERVNERAIGGRNHVKVDEEMRRCIAAIYSTRIPF